jgi:hypothetical protein
MAEHGLLSAPNMAVGEPFNIGLTAAALTNAMPEISANGGVAGIPGGSPYAPGQ